MLAEWLGRLRDRPPLRTLHPTKARAEARRAPKMKAKLRQEPRRPFRDWLAQSKVELRSAGYAPQGSLNLARQGHAPLERSRIRELSEPGPESIWRIQPNQ